MTTYGDFQCHVMEKQSQVASLYSEPPCRTAYSNQTRYIKTLVRSVTNKLPN